MFPEVSLEGYNTVYAMQTMGFFLFLKKGCESTVCLKFFKLTLVVH